MTFEEAKDIFETKKYEDPPMRGRQSMSPLVKLGLVYIIEGKVTISDVGRKLAKNEIEFDDFMMDSLLKFQYPNPYEGGYKDWNTKPFINTLPDKLIKLIKKDKRIIEILYKISDKKLTNEKYKEIIEILK